MAHGIADIYVSFGPLYLGSDGASQFNFELYSGGHAIFAGSWGIHRQGKNRQQFFKDMAAMYYERMSEKGVFSYIITNGICKLPDEYGEKFLPLQEDDLKLFTGTLDVLLSRSRKWN